jgi:hypothetical protein
VRKVSREVGIALGVVERFRPNVLIEGLDGDAVLADHQAHAPAAYGFGVREMCQNFGDGPFPRLGARGELFLAQGFDEFLQLLDGFLLHLQRFFALHIAESAMDVLLGRFLHGSLRRIS